MFLIYQDKKKSILNRKGDPLQTPLSVRESLTMESIFILYQSINIKINIEP